MCRWLANVFRLGLQGVREPRQRQGAGRSSSSIRSRSPSTASRPACKTDVANAPVAMVDSDRSAALGAHPGRLAQALLPPPGSDRSRRGRSRDGPRRLYVRARYPARTSRPTCCAGGSRALQLNIDATAMTQAGVGASYVEVDRAAGDQELSAVRAASRPQLPVTRGDPRVLQSRTSRASGSSP